MKLNNLSSLLLGALVGAFSTSAVAADNGCPAPAPAPEKSSCCDSCFPSGGKFKAGVDYIYWETVEGSLTIGNRITENADGVTIKNENIRPNFGAKSGVKGNIGYEFGGDDKWDIVAYYGWLPGEASTAKWTTTDNDQFNQRILLKTQNYDILGAVTKLDQGSDLSANYNTMSGTWKTINQGVALELGRTLAFGKKFTMRPHAGLKGAWGHQSYVFGGTVEPGSDVPEKGITTLNVNLFERYRSIAAQVGLWATWKICWGISVVGHIGGSSGYTDWLLKESLLLVDDKTGVLADAHETDRYPSIGFGVDYYIGLLYSYEYCHMTFSAKLGWEQHVSQQNIINAIGANLGTQGLTAGLSVSF